MPLGQGYFFNRRTGKYIKIDEHATDALKKPKVFKTEHLQHLNPVTDRDTIVISVLKEGFIRIRDWKGQIGWQFWGDKPAALKQLRKYIKSYDVGDYATITFTDFETGEEEKNIAKNFLKNDK